MLDYNTTGLDWTPHTECDTGGEFVAAYSSDLSFIPPQDWIIPTADLVAIFALAQRAVNASDIEECALVFYAGSLAIKYFSALVEPLETSVVGVAAGFRPGVLLRAAQPRQLPARPASAPRLLANASPPPPPPTLPISFTRRRR